MSSLGLAEIHIQKTEDGSDTLFSEVFQSTYHSTYGALTESQHVFIQSGLNAMLPAISEISVLEFGIGLGLNAWLLMQECANNSVLRIDYTGLELFPVSPDVYTKTSVYLDDPEAFDLIHSKNSFCTEYGFTFCRQEINMLHYQEKSSADLIFYDAFSPDVQPDMWTPEQMKRCAEALKPGGYWVSYCSKGEVRRSLIAAGLTVERLPGPPGKREMLRACKLS